MVLFKLRDKKSQGKKKQTKKKLVTEQSDSCIQIFKKSCKWLDPWAYCRGTLFDQNSVFKANKWNTNASLLTIEPTAYFCLPSRLKTYMYVPVLSLGVFFCCCFERTYFDLWASKLFYFPSDAQEGLPPKCGLIALISSLCSPSTGAGVREFYKERSVRNVNIWITIGNVFKN